MYRTATVLDQRLLVENPGSSHHDTFAITISQRRADGSWSEVGGATQITSSDGWSLARCIEIAVAVNRQCGLDVNVGSHEVLELAQAIQFVTRP